MRRWLADDGGGVASLAAVFGTLITLSAALAVDLGSVALHARRVQAAADLGALAAARDLDRAEDAAGATVAANLPRIDTLRVQPGRYRPDPMLEPAARFTAGEIEPDSVRVTVTASAPLYFGRLVTGRESVPVRRSATAALSAAPPAVAFSIGSRLARLDGGVANQLLSALTGSHVSLSVMDYRRLADAEVSLLGMLDALKTDLNLEAAGYDEVLATEVAAPRVLDALAEVAPEASREPLGRLARATASDRRLRLDRLVSLQVPGPAAVKVSALDLAMATLEIANAERQLELDLDAEAGLAAIEVRLAIGQRPEGSPWLTVTDEATPVIRTAQARLYVQARTAQSLSGLGQLTLPLLVELAPAEARLAELDCEDARPVTLEARPGVARAVLGQVDVGRLDDFSQALEPQAATLLSVARLVRIEAEAEIEAADPAWTEIAFSRAEAEAGTIKTVRTTALAEGLVSSLLGRARLRVQTLGLGLGLGGLAQAAQTLLQPLGPLLDELIVPLLDLLGLRLGEADLRIAGLDCPDPGARRPSLVG